MGMVYFLEKARMFTLGCPNLLVIVYHLPLIPILGDRSLADIPNPRLYRLKEKCLIFRFAIKYCPGKFHKGPDYMSRVFGDEETEKQSMTHLTHTLSWELPSVPATLTTSTRTRSSPRRTRQSQSRK